MQGNKTTQASRFAEALKLIKPDVTPDDRADAMKKFDISNATVSRYLEGEVRNNDLAASLITFFKSRIQQREKAVA